MKQSRHRRSHPNDYCYSASGPVLLLRGTGRDILNPGMPVSAGDIIKGAEQGFCEIEFADGSRVAVGSSSEVRIERSSFDGDADIADIELTVLSGAAVFQASAVSTGRDSHQINGATMSVAVRMARVGVLTDPSGLDMVTLASPKRGRLIGDALAQSRLGSRALTTAWQSVRCNIEQADLSPAMVIPKSVIDEMFGPFRISTYLAADIDRKSTMESDLPPAFDTGTTAFEPFQALGDRLFERRFVPGSLFPKDFQEGSGYDNDLLEDAFDGRRFRLPAEED